MMIMDLCGQPRDVGLGGAWKASRNLKHYENFNASANIGLS